MLGGAGYEGMGDTHRSLVRQMERFQTKQRCAAYKYKQYDQQKFGRWGGRRTAIEIRTTGAMLLACGDDDGNGMGEGEIASCTSARTRCDDEFRS